MFAALVTTGQVFVLTTVISMLVALLIKGLYLGVRAVSASGDEN